MRRIRFIIFAIFCLSIGINVKATSTEENVDFNDSSYEEIELERDGFTSVVDSFVMEDGSYFLLVYERSYSLDVGSDFSDSYYLLKYNSEGEIVRSDRIITQEQQKILKKKFKRIISLEDDTNKLILASDKRLYSYDLNNQTLQTIEFPSIGVVEDSLNDLIPLNDEQGSLNGFLVVGKSFGYEQTPDLQRGYIARYNENYELEWINFLDGIESEIYKVLQVNRVEYAVVGKKFTCVSSPTFPCSGHTSGFVAKYDFTGNKIWHKEIDRLMPYAITKTHDNHIIVAGKTTKQSGVITNDDPRYVAGIMKLNHQYGNIVWESEYYNKDIKSEGIIITDIIETEEKNLIATAEITTYDLKISRSFDPYHVENHLRDSLGTYTNNYIRGGTDVRPGLIVKLNGEGDPIAESLMRQMLYYNIEPLTNDRYLFTGDVYKQQDTELSVRGYRRPELFAVKSVTTLDELDMDEVEGGLFLRDLSPYIFLIVIATPIILISLITNARKDH